MEWNRKDAAALAAIWIPFSVLVARFWFVCDDAYITFRYARNWVNGHGLRFNLGEHPPVEGFSNFLWVVVSAAIELLGGDPVFWAPAISAACGLVLLALVYHALFVRLGLTRGVSFLATLALGCFPPFAVWSTSGLETMPFALALFVTFDWLVLREDPRPYGAAIAAIALTLLRTEGVAWALVIAVLAVAVRRPARAVSAYVGVVLGVFAVYFTARYGYYGLPFPNPVYTKVGFAADVALRGFRYVATFYVTFLTPFVVFVAMAVALRARSRTLVSVVVMALAFPVYAIVVGGDWLTMGRFLVPGLPFHAVLVGVLLQSLAPRRALVLAGVSAAIVVGLLPGFGYHLVPREIREEFRFRYFNPKRTEYELWVAQKTRPQRAKATGLALASISKPGDSLVIGAIGAIGYYSDLFVYDRYGLVSVDVAMRPRGEDEPLRAPGHDGKVSRSFFLDQDPTYVAIEVIEGDDLAARVVAQADAWRKLHASTLWRRYVPDFAILDDAEGYDGVVMVLRLIEESPDDPVLEMARPERRRVRAKRARKLWDAFYERAHALGGDQKTSSTRQRPVSAG